MILSTWILPRSSSTQLCADTVLTGRPGLILGLLSGRLDMAEARNRGLEFSGSRKALHRVVGAWGAGGPKA